MSLSYHEAELAIALDSTDPRHALPVSRSEYRRILDVGCGMGQSLIAMRLPLGVEGYGIDIDKEAISAGQKVVPVNIQLALRDSYRLPYPDGYFDFVFARVSIPLMDINSTLSEISRVLKPTGDVWMLLHPASMIWRRLWRSLLSGRLADVLYCSYVMTNGVIFHLTGMQLSVRNRWESFQTRSGMNRALRRAGLQPKLTFDHVRFIVEATK